MNKKEKTKKLEKIAEEIKVCRKCPLHKNTTPICSRECMKEWQRERVENNLIRRSKKTGPFLPSKLGRS